VAARVFDWSETVTGAPLQVALGVAFAGWGLLHIPAARRLTASDDDLVVVSRRVLGSGPPTIDTEPAAVRDLCAWPADQADVEFQRLNALRFSERATRTFAPESCCSAAQGS